MTTPQLPELTTEQSFALAANRLRMTEAVNDCIAIARSESRQCTTADFVVLIDIIIDIQDQCLQKETWCKEAIKNAWGL